MLPMFLPNAANLSMVVVFDELCVCLSVGQEGGFVGQVLLLDLAHVRAPGPFPLPSLSHADDP